MLQSGFAGAGRGTHRGGFRECVERTVVAGVSGAGDGAGAALAGGSGGGTGSTLATGGGGAAGTLASFG
jgi:hypothetical protein